MQIMYPLTYTTDALMGRLRRHTTAGPVIRITVKNLRRLHVATCFVTSTCGLEWLSPDLRSKTGCRCISTAIMKDARCPVCEAPTLLYCLFRIDTSA